MPDWRWVVDSLAVGVIALFVLVLWLILRRWLLVRRPQTPFDMSVNERSAIAAAGWTLGFAVYRGPELHWYRTFSLSVRPKYRFARCRFQLGERRDPKGTELEVLPPGRVILAVDDPSGVSQVGLSTSALTALLSWLESSPPGERVNNVV